MSRQSLPRRNTSAGATARFSKFALFAHGFILIAIAFAFAELLGTWNVPTYQRIESAWNRLGQWVPGRHDDHATADSPNEAIPVEMLETNVAALINLSTASDVRTLRRRFIELLWSWDGLPLENLPVIQLNISDDKYDHLPGLKQLDRLKIDTSYGLNSISYRFTPRNANGRLIIYHQGHRGDFYHGKSVIGQFLEAGYTVVAVAMPMRGMNNQPLITLKRFGKIRLNRHDDLRWLSADEKHPIHVFLEPVIAIVNLAEQEGYSSIGMIGISGGGWTATLAAAVDTRIDVSFPVAGTLPIFLRMDDGTQDEWWDYENAVPEVYLLANYLELYVLASTGGHRRSHLQILNRYDPCCTSGMRYQTYERTVQNLVRELGSGSFRVFLDESHREHKISTAAIVEAMAEFERLGAN